MKGFLTGIGLGAAIGLWLAPEAGSETRKKLITRGADLMQRLEKTLENKTNVAEGNESPHAEVEQPEAVAEAQGSSDNEESQSTLDPVAEILNSASKTKLRSVPGIGDATARRIIESRPFESEAEVLENKVIPEKVLKSLKDTLVDPDEEVA